MSEGAQNVIANAMFDPIYQRALGLDEIIAAALQARAYMSKYKISPEQTAEAAAKALTQASKNKNVFRGKKITAKQVLASKMLSSPIHELEAFVPADGACALMLASEEQAGRWTKNPVWISGAGTAIEEYYLGDRVLSSARALKEAAKRAYKMAVIKHPEKEVDLVELSNYFSFQELMYPEALGLCAPGKGAALLASGKTMADGKLPVNPSGGVLGGSPLCVSGLARVIEAANQISGEAGNIQVKKPVKTALAQGSYGPAGQSQCVLVLSGDDKIKAKVKTPARKKGKK
jgi:acetyl-CoA C-acetyltransferase